MEAAKARGVHLGRVPLEKPEGFEKVLAQWKARDLSGREAAQRLDESHSALDMRAQEGGG